MQVIETPGVSVKAWIDGVQLEDQAKQQLVNVATMPFIWKWVAAMPDVHWGMGATVGSVIPMDRAIIPAAVGVDIGCGMMAVKTSMNARDLPDSLHELRSAIEAAVPHGRTDNGGRNDRGAWGKLPEVVEDVWLSDLLEKYSEIVERHPKISGANHVGHLGTLGTGNHFIEVCLDQDDGVWVMLHSGSRGIGNRIGSYFIELAKKDMERYFINLPDKDLAYLPEGTEHFNEYIKAVSWAQGFALHNRQIMMRNTLKAVEDTVGTFVSGVNFAVNCHHNYVQKEKHFGKDVWLTRKGAVSAREGEYGIIPGSMGAKSFIVKGRGNRDSFMSCSHGAGRSMSRTEAKRRFTLVDHIAATEGVECRKDEDVIDETPMAYKDIMAVMAAQEDLVDIVYTLKQVLCVKG
jgi:tRNA-splicing ligase RtcB